MNFANASKTSHIEDSSSCSGEDLRQLMADVAIEQDRTAFRTLFMHYAPRIKALMLGSGASATFAEDLVQEVMMTVWNKASLYRPERGSVNAWVFTIARNARIDRLRRGGTQPYEDIDELDLVAPDGDGESEAMASERVELVARAMAELPQEQQKIIELAFMQDLSQSEIAKRMSLPLGTVKSRMRLAYGKLRSSLEHLE